MAYFRDLTRYEYSNHLFWCAGEPLNVGWLEGCTPYPKGVVAPELVEKLRALCEFPVHAPLGRHCCPFCLPKDPFWITVSGIGEIRAWTTDSGSGEIRVPAADGTCTYIAPSLIYHYVVAHEYLPPQVFLDALNALSLPRPGAAQILGVIEDCENNPGCLSSVFDWVVTRDKQSIPPELLGAVLKAANDLKVIKSLGPDTSEMVERIINELKSELTKR